MLAGMYVFESRTWPGLEIAQQSTAVTRRIRKHVHPKKNKYQYLVEQNARKRSGK